MKSGSAPLLGLNDYKARLAKQLDNMKHDLVSHQEVMVATAKEIDVLTRNMEAILVDINDVDAALFLLKQHGYEEVKPYVVITQKV